ncbi:PrsW family intramembrane metalloprotease [Micromonospora sp. H33]|uniref:PrsW family intramembrane metalloprotease n=1 Tax=Micromonospora sp. H33 TaxID=3452215 RepID=UPI003F8A1174
MADTPPGTPLPTPPTAAPLPPSVDSVTKAPRRRVSWVRALVLTAVILFIAGCAVFMVWTLGESLGGEALLIGVIAAVLPVPVLVSCFLWLDRYEPEPLKYLIFCFAWGAFVSTAASLTVNNFAADWFERLSLPTALTAVLVAPFIEELTKALGPILLLIFRRREFSGITDALVYCGLSAIGFAMVENILYLGGYGYATGVERYGPATGTQQVIAIFIVRILLFGFAHPLFTSMTGVGLGIAARAADRRVRVLAPAAGLLLAMMLHGTWNLLPTLTQATGQPLILLYGFIGVMVPIFFGMVGLAVWLRSWEGRLTERTLPDYVQAGWLTPPEVAALSSLGRRHAARVWAKRVGGDAGLKAMRGYQFAATRLALLRDGMRRGLDRRPVDRARAAAEEQHLLQALSGYRAYFVGRDPQAPVGVWDGRRYHLRFPDGSQRPVDAPDEPVVPIPVVLAPPPPPPIFPGYGPPPGWPGVRPPAPWPPGRP